MKIGITINADYGKELYLHENSEKLKSELLGVVEQFIGEDTCIDYEQEDAQIDAMTGEVVNYNPYPIQRQFSMNMIRNICLCKERFQLLYYKANKIKVLRGKNMSDRIYELYKRIMKHDPKAIDEIETLKEAKEIINMMAGTVYINGQAYQMMEHMKEDFYKEEN